MASVEKVTQITHNRFLNYYELSTINRIGKRGSYYMASRAQDISALDLSTGENTPDGVVIFGLAGKRHDCVVLVRQYRYPLAGYVYELPAGLIERHESYKKAAVREMKEETGLVFHPLDVDPMYERAFYNSVGMTDESCILVYGYCDGTISREGLEDSEELDVVLADRQEAIRILREEKAAANCAYMLMQFIAHPEDPFSFLKKPEELNRYRQESGSAQQTWEAGYQMGLSARAGEVVTLIGDLGAGKTVFTQGFAAGIGIREAVNSPTFTILQVYEGGRLPLYHFDVYRIGDSEEMLEIGWEDYVYGEGVCLIEWADQISDLIDALPPGKVRRVEIRKDLSKGTDWREILQTTASEGAVRQ